MARGQGSEQGYTSFLGAAKETAWGTKVVPPTTFFEFNSEGLSCQDAEQIPETMNGDRAFTRRLQGSRSVSGSIEGPFNPGVDFVIMLLANALGGDITSTPVAGEVGAFKHVIEAGDIVNGDVSSLTLVKRLGLTDQFLYAGCRVNSLTIKCDQGNFVSITAEIVGKDSESHATVITPILVDVEPCNFPAVSLWIAALGTDPVQAAGNLQTIQSFELTITNNLITDDKARSLGSKTIDVLVPARREIKLKISQRYDSTEMIDRSKLGVPYMAEILLASRDTILAAGTQKYDTLVELPEIYYNVAEPGASDMGIIGLEPEFTCVKSKTEGFDIQATVHNATETY